MAKKVSNTPDINEFLDWISGVNSITGITEWKDNIIGGGAIRKLLQDHLKNPFYVHKDDDNNRKLLFSSESSYKIWAKARQQKNITTVEEEKNLSKIYRDLVLLEFDIPPAHTLTIGKSIGESLSQLYVLDKGNNSRVSGNIEFVYYIDNGDGTYLSEADITISVIDTLTQRVKGTIARHNDREYSDGIRKTSFDVSNYLTTGKNRFDITIRLTENVKTNIINTSFFINVIQFNISLLYQGNKSFNEPYRYVSGQNQNEYTYDPLDFKISCYKSINETCSIKINTKIDGDELPEITDSAWQGQTLTKELIVNPNRYLASYMDGDETINVKHSILISAEITTEDSHIFKSNLLYYTFENEAYDAPTSSKMQLNNNFINIAQSISEEKTNSFGEYILVGYQYNKFTLKWGYYTDEGPSIKQINWKIHKKRYDELEYIPSNEDIYIATLKGNSGMASDDLIFIPEKVFTESDNAYLIATIINNSKEYVIYEQPIIINETKFDRTFNEWSGAALKLNAYGRSNNEDPTSRNKWSFGDYSTTFSSRFPFDVANGWNDNALCFSGERNYATINFNAFVNNNTYNFKNTGRSIEIDFKTTNVYNEDDELLIIGNKNGTGAYIIVYPSKTVFYNGSTALLTTNYKSNERIQLTFIIMREVTGNPNSKNIYIINNGVLERGAQIEDYNTLKNEGSSANIKLGGSNSGINVYNIRVWYNDMTQESNNTRDMDIAIYNAFLNYLFDTEEKTTIISRNAVTNGSSPDPYYEACVKKIDTFLIEGNLDDILNAGTKKDASTSAVDITYISNTDPSLGFTASNIRIRKHGQSTLNYPISSFKIWLNKSFGENTSPSIIFQPDWMLDDIYKVKNRYAIKPGNIPANKFVLQANYADSSGVHNGGLLRLINDTWYNANFGTNDNPCYRLRTAPQLFTSGQIVEHTEHDPNVSYTAWTEGYGNTNKVFGNLPATEHTWPELAKALKDLPELPIFKYKIRNAPDSLPCVVFYRKNPELPATYLGQFVLMDDKKSDHIYGERSIYLWDDINDPFCMTYAGANDTVINSDGEAKRGHDRDANCCWDNKNVLRIECVLINTSLTSFMSTLVAESVEVDEDGNPIGDGTGVNPCTAIKYATDDNGQQVPVNYYWEDYFELIFPDEEDIEEDVGISKFSGSYKTKAQSENPNYTWPENTSKFIKKTQSWIDFLYWICDIGTINKDALGQTYSPNPDPSLNNTVSEAALQKFIRTAHEHLDLYKMAAYYIFYIRFGLVDSVERNAQFKTYDGKHWFCEPWDMDIALGNKNTGGLVFNPPMTRDTMLGQEVWAYSGRSTSTSNVLWDMLESWSYWTNVIVPDTAAALSKAGLTYDNICKVFDEDYANKWSELLYNNSGLYKYVTAALDAKWLGWLQGSRMSHRHWWISTSMNYYDSKWTCGQFDESRIYLAVNKAQGSVATLTLTPTTSTFFKLTQKDGETNLGLISASPINPARYNLTSYSFSAKDPTHIYGALFIEKVDFGEFGKGIDKLIFQNAVDKVTGPTIKEFSIGCQMVDKGNGTYEGWFNSSEIGITKTSSINSVDEDTTLTDPLLNVETYNATGQLTLASGDIIQEGRVRLKNIYAAGTKLINFSSTASGNSFNELQLPANNIIKENNTIVNSFNSLTMSNSSWDEISFWDCTYPQNVQMEPLMIDDPDHPGQQIEATDDLGNVIYVKVNPIATYKKLTRIQNGQTVNDIPLSLKSITFEGSTCQNKCSAEFILSLFTAIENDIKKKYPSLIGDALEEKVLEAISDENTGYNASLENIRWNYDIGSSDENYISLTYKDIVRLGHLNHRHNVDDKGNAQYISGYVKIEGTEMTPFQLRELMELFGDNAFNINSIDNNLVIDQAQQYSRITVSGAGIDIIDNIIYINEGVSVKFKCTNFLLTNEAANDYDWAVSGGKGYEQKFTGGDESSGYAYLTVTFKESDMGLTQEYYTATIIATHKQDPSKHAELEIRVRPVSITDNWTWRWEYNMGSSVAGVREFICNDSVAESLFPDYYLDQRNNRVPIYIIPHGEFDGELILSTLTDFNATLDSISYSFNTVQDSGVTLDSALPISITDATWTEDKKSYEVVKVGNDGRIMRVCESNEVKKTYQYFGDGRTKRVRNSIRLVTHNDDERGYAARTEEMRLVTVLAKLNYKSSVLQENPTYFRCNFILYNDNTAITSINTNLGKSLIYHLHKTYQDITQYYRTANSLYKSDMASLVGNWEATILEGNEEIKIPSTGNLNVIGGRESIFDYCVNLTSIDMSSQTGITLTKGDITGDVFDFSKLTKLETLNLENTGVNYVIDLKSSNMIKTVNLKGTQCDIIADSCNSLIRLDLGQPKNITIKTCSSINDTNVTCQSSTRVNSQDGSITIILPNDLSNNPLYGFKLFNNIYDPTA